MDRVNEKERSVRKTRDERDKERDSSKDHYRDLDRHRDQDRDRKHRSRDVRSRESEERHHSDKYREEKYSSKDNDGLKDRVSGSRHSKDDRHRDGDRHRSRDYWQDYDSKRERSYEPRDGREGSRDRVFREESVERRSSASHKRKELGESEDRMDKIEKRVRVSDGVKEEKRERRRFEDKVVDDRKDLNGIDREESGEGGIFEDGTGEEERGDLTGSGRGVKRERRKFEGQPKEEDVTVFEESKRPVSVWKSERKQTVDDQVDNAQSIVNSTGNGSGSIANWFLS